MARPSAQLVTFEGLYTSSAASLLQKSAIKGLDYHTVAIVGCQSTGKSTLLNLLFGTNFDVLDLKKGRFQTTKGINLSWDEEHRVVVVDIEGTDSQSRGDSGSSFEHMSALFALAVSDLLFVNLWTHELGRYKAASLGLLQTIFEANLKLFSAGGKKKIAFLLRDFNYEKNDFQVLIKQLNDTMERLWTLVQQPRNCCFRTLSDCFDFDFFPLASKDYEFPRFSTDVKSLQSRLVDSEASEYVFAGVKTDVPIDGVDVYFKRIWDIIWKDKDLNLPCQKEMVANLRCNDIKSQVFSEFKKDVFALTKNARKTFVPRFADRSRVKVEDALAIYDAEAGGYSEEVYEKVREELGEMMLKELKDAFLTILEGAEKAGFRSFEDKFVKRLNGDRPEPQFMQKATDISLKIISDFQEKAAESILPGSDWTYDTQIEALSQGLSERIQVLLRDQKQLFSTYLHSVLSSSLNQSVTKIISSGQGEELWPALRQVQSQVMMEVEGLISEVMPGFDESEDAVNLLIADFRAVSTLLIRAKVDKFLTGLNDHLRKVFETRFRKDELGIPRNWERTDIDQIFIDCKQHSIAVLDAFRTFKIPPNWNAFEDSLGQETYELLLSDTEYEALRESLNLHAELAYKSAVSLKQAGQHPYKIPGWMIVLMLLLAGNEVWWVLRSPIFFPIFLFLLCLLGLTFALGLGSIPFTLLKLVLHRSGLYPTSWERR